MQGSLRQGPEDMPLVVSVETADKPQAKQQTRHETTMKWVALSLLIFQNSGAFLLTRYTRTTTDGPMYLSTVVVLLTEVAKLIFCLGCAPRTSRVRP